MADHSFSLSPFRAAIFAPLLALRVFLSVPVQAETMPDLRGFDRNVFDYHLERADRETSPGRWMEEARRGISLACGGWERIAAELYRDPELRAGAEGQIARWTEAELEERFSQWLLKRFFGSGIEAYAGRIAEGIEEAGIAYTYHLDDRGNILYDGDTGDPVIVRPGEDGRDFSADRELWQARAGDILHREIESYRASLAALFPELLGYISPENRGGFERKLQDLALSAASGLRRDFEGILSREERLFTARRTGDLWSLRRKSENESAGSISGEIIRDTQAACNEGIAALNARVEAASAGEGDLALAGTEWLAAYREQFDRGLRAWEEAEERFFIRRIEWEQEAGKNYLEGEEAWSAAFAKFEEARRGWELQSKALFESGETLFRKASETLEYAVAEARAEFDRDARLRTTAGAERARAWVDMYVTSSMVVAGARENIDFWLDEYGGEDAPPWWSGSFNSWIDQQAQLNWSDAYLDYINRAEYKECEKAVSDALGVTQITFEDIKEEYLALDAEKKALRDKIKKLEDELKIVEEKLKALGYNSEARLRKVKILEMLKTARQELQGVNKRQGEIAPWYNNYGAKHAEALGIYRRCVEEFNRVSRFSLKLEKALAGELGGPGEEALALELREAEIYMPPRLDMLREIRKWLELYQTYITKALKARDALIADFSMVMGSGALADVLAEGVSRDDFTLDEYQIELIRAKAVAAYWDKRHSTAEAVLAYAEEISAGRMTNSEGVKAWEGAKQSYDQALAAYESAQARLSAEGAALGTAQASLREAAVKLEAANARLEELNQEYALLMGAFAAEENGFLLDDLGGKYAELIKEHKLLSGGGDPSCLRYLRRIHDLGLARERERSGDVLKQTLEGVYDGGKSLAVLAEAAASVISLSGEDEPPDDMAAYGLGEDDPRFTLIWNLLLERNAALAAAGDVLEAETVRELYRTLIVRITRAAKTEAEQRLALRRAGLELLRSDSFKDWYFAVSGVPRNDGTEAALEAGGIESRLQDDLFEKRRTLLKARIDLELEALGYYSDGTAGREEAKVLAALCSLDAEKTGKALEALEAVSARWAVLEQADPEEYERLLAELVQENPVLGGFIRGGSFFNAPSGLNGARIAEMFLSPLSAAAGWSEALLELYRVIGPQSAVGRREAGERALEDMRALFSSYGISPPPADQYLPGMARVGAALSARGTNRGETLALFLAELDRHLELLPPWLADEFGEWKTALIDYMAAKAVYDRSPAPASSAGIRERAEGLAEREEIFRTLHNLLAAPNTETLPILSEVLKLPGDDFGPVDRETMEAEAAYLLGRSPGDQEDRGYLPGDMLIAAINYRYRNFIAEKSRLDYEYLFAVQHEEMAGAAEAAAREGRKHWRQFITGAFLAEYNTDKRDNEKLPPGLLGGAEGDYTKLKAARGWNEGVLADAFDRAERKTAMLNAAAALYVSGTVSAETAPMIEPVQVYLEDPFTLWDQSFKAAVPYSLYDAYYYEAGEMRKHINLEEALRKEIARLGSGYESSREGQEGIQAELDRLSRNIGLGENAYNETLKDYSRTAAAFQNAGLAYDGIYTEVQELFRRMEDARSLYETQDAIRRWASTAYLEAGDRAASSGSPWQSPADERAYSKERLDRANIALAALTSLYDSGETRRPYEDSAYERLYREYQASFKRLILSMKAQESLERALRKETEINNRLYNSYKSALDTLGETIALDPGYNAPADRSGWKISDLIALENGRLRFSYDGGFVLSGMTASKAQALNGYFKADKSLTGEAFKASNFELALRGLADRLEARISSFDAYRNFALARDYLIWQLAENNPQINALAGFYNRAQALREESNLGQMPLLDRTIFIPGNDRVYQTANHFQDSLHEMQEEAWKGLSAGERADLEFYIILTLTGGGGDKAAMFSRISEMEEFRYLQGAAQNTYDYYQDLAGIPIVGLLYKGNRDKARATLDALEASLEELEKMTESGYSGLVSSLDNIRQCLEDYQESSADLLALRGQKTGGAVVSWADLSAALITAGDLNSAEMAQLEVHWYRMIADRGNTSRDVSEALRSLVQWARITREDSKQSLENKWAGDEQARQAREKQYREIFDACIDGRAGMGELRTALAGAFGSAAPGWKNHMENFERVLMGDLGIAMTSGSGYGVEYTALAEEYSALIERVYAMRFNAELAAREAEWNQQRKDIEEKHRAWKETAALILSRGRSGWKEGEENLLAGRNQWAKRYAEEYKRTADAWTEAYLAGLEDKEAWTAMAADAADRASTGAILALLGSSAERGARAMDVRNPAGIFAGDAAGEAEKLLAGILGNAGITNMAAAFAAMNGSAGVLSTQVRRGLGGPSAWNGGLIQAEAKKTAKEANAEIAAREAKRLAAQVQRLTDEALGQLSGSVYEANKSFRESMDEVFIIGGQWRRKGGQYIKDVIVHSTFVQQVITESASVEGYEDYVMEPFNLSTDLSENRLRDLNAPAIQALIGNMYKEVAAISGGIFGSGDGKGKFDAHRGDQPVLREDLNPGGSKDALFENKGSGEMGRLLTEYYYWMIREGSGVRMLASADWDKPLWDSRGSSFEAPSIRQAAGVVNQIAGTVVSCIGGPCGMLLSFAVNMSNDLLFFALDVAGSYKTIDEAGFELGKSALINTAGIATGGIFNGVSGITGGITKAAVGKASSQIGQAVVKTAMTGLQTAVTTTATSALGAVNYRRGEGLSFSTDAFAAGMKNGAVNLAGSMTSTFTGGILGAVSNTHTGSLFQDNGKLTRLAGGIAGQGVQRLINGESLFDTEGMFEFGKKTLIGLAGSAVDDAFKGLNGAISGKTAGGGIGETMVRTAMTGLQSMTTDAVTGLINGISFTNRDGWGFSGDALMTALNEGAVHMAGSMGSAFTGEMLEILNKSAAPELLREGSFLSEFTAGLSGQTLEYFLRGEAAFDAEAAFKYGQRALSVMADSAIDRAFDGFYGDPGKIAALGGVGEKALLAVRDDLQAALTGAADGLINGISFTSRDGWGFSGDALVTALGGGAVNMAGSLGSVLADEMLDRINKSPAGRAGAQLLSGGEAFFSTLNTTLPLQGRLSAGPLELRLDSSGMSLDLGGENLDMNPASLSSIYKAVKDIKTWDISWDAGMEIAVSQGLAFRINSSGGGMNSGHTFGIDADFSPGALLGDKAGEIGQMLDRLNAAAGYLDKARDLIDGFKAGDIGRELIAGAAQFNQVLDGGLDALKAMAGAYGGGIGGELLASAGQFSQALDGKFSAAANLLARSEMGMDYLKQLGNAGMAGINGIQTMLNGGTGKAVYEKYIAQTAAARQLSALSELLDNYDGLVEGGIEKGKKALGRSINSLRQEAAGFQGLNILR